MIERDLQFPDFPDHFREIGRVAAYWSLLEDLIKNAIWDRLRIDALRGTIITAEMNNFNQLQNLFMSLVSPPFASPETKKKFDKFFDNKLKPIKARRNELIHTVWIGDETVAIAVSPTAKGQLKTPMTGWTVDGIRHVAEQVKSATEEFYDLYRDHGMPLLALPDKPALRTRLP